MQLQCFSILFIVIFFSYECYVLSIWILYVHFCWHSCSSGARVQVSRVSVQRCRVSHLTSLHWHCHLIVTNASAGKWSYNKAWSDVTLIDIIIASVLHLLSRHCRCRDSDRYHDYLVATITATPAAVRRTVRAGSRPPHRRARRGRLPSHWGRVLEAEFFTSSLSLCWLCSLDQILAKRE